MTIDEVDGPFAARFAEQFAETWRTPDLAKHEALWSDDIVLTQPMMGSLRGKQACREAFARLFALVPDLHADVHRVAHGALRHLVAGARLDDGLRQALEAVTSVRLVRGAT